MTTENRHQTTGRLHSSIRKAVAASVFRVSGFSGCKTGKRQQREHDNRPHHRGGQSREKSKTHQEKDQKQKQQRFQPAAIASTKDEAQTRAKHTENLCATPKVPVHGWLPKRSRSPQYHHSVPLYPPPSTQKALPIHQLQSPNSGISQPLSPYNPVPPG